MRQPNRVLPGVSRPVEILWPNIYNRPALDVTSTLPLSTSLNNLRPMVFNLPLLRQAMTEDGGLEALIDIMSTVRRTKDPNEAHVRKLALQCLTQFGIRGPESIRVRTVEAQIVPVLVTMLELFWRAMEPDIRDSIERSLQPSSSSRANASSSKPLQVLTRRRAVTIGSISTSPERLNGLHIRLPINRSALTRPPTIISSGSVDPSASPQTNVNENSGVPIDVDRDRMDVDTSANNEVEEEGGIDDTITDAEALRSPPPEEDVSFSSAFPTENQNPSSQMPPAGSPTIRSTSMDIDGPTVSRVDPQVSEGSSPLPSARAVPMAPSSPMEIMERGPVPPNAPLIPYAVPPVDATYRHLESLQHSHVPSVSLRRISALHTTSQQDWRVPRSEDIHECLETLAYLSKYPKLRAYFNSTRFVPSLLYHWATPEDSIKEVNVFEIVERFTFSKYHPDTICFWASIVMRHYSRKDDVVTKRQCGNLQCRAWETDDPGKKFICCPKCKYSSLQVQTDFRRTRYCSKGCFSRAWPGHSHWCVDHKKQRDKDRAQAAPETQREQEQQPAEVDTTGITEPTPIQPQPITEMV